jgi:hypothetical protein
MLRLGFVDDGNMEITLGRRPGMQQMGGTVQDAEFDLVTTLWCNCKYSQVKYSDEFWNYAAGMHNCVVVGFVSGDWGEFTAAKRTEVPGAIFPAVEIFDGIPVFFVAIPRDVLRRVPGEFVHLDPSKWGLQYPIHAQVLGAAGYLQLGDANFFRDLAAKNMDRAIEFPNMDIRETPYLNLWLLFTHVSEKTDFLITPDDVTATGGGRHEGLLAGRMQISQEPSPSVNLSRTAANLLRARGYWEASDPGGKHSVSIQRTASGAYRINDPNFDGLQEAETAQRYALPNSTGHSIREIMGAHGWCQTWSFMDLMFSMQGRPDIYTALVNGMLHNLEGEPARLKAEIDELFGDPYLGNGYAYNDFLIRPKEYGFRGMYRCRKIGVRADGRADGTKHAPIFIHASVLKTLRVVHRRRRISTPTSLIWLIRCWSLACADMQVSATTPLANNPYLGAPDPETMRPIIRNPGPDLTDTRNTSYKRTETMLTSFMHSRWMMPFTDRAM